MDRRLPPENSPLPPSSPSAQSSVEIHAAGLAQDYFQQTDPRDARSATHQSEIRHRNCPDRRQAADHGHRSREARHGAGKSRTLRPLQGQGVDGIHQVTQEPAERQADPGNRSDPDACRRGQDDDDRRSDRCAQPHRQEGDALSAGAEPRPLFRGEGRRVAWRRAIDMNDRSLRQIVSSLGGVANGFPREDGFDITVASEVMAIFCLAKDLEDLKQRLANVIIGYTRDRKPVRAGDLKAQGPMTALLKDALSPNLVQTLEGTPAFIHGGPFANIAHGCNSVLATTTALKLADYVVTEAGFGADLGGEKFLDIKCRKAGIAPDCAVLVATIRALKMHGGVKKEDLKTENLKALEAGMSNLQRHVENVRKFGIEPVISINRFSADTEAEIKLVEEKCKALGVEALMADHWAMGGEGAANVAKAVVKICESGKSKLKFLYPDDMPLLEKIRTIAKEIYRARDISVDKSVRDQLANFESMGYGKFPICVAKTQYSFSTNPDAKGAPVEHIINVREVRLSAGAEFVVAVCGEIMTMPGLPRVPAADSIDVAADGKIVGLF